jgi:hypothetical protein
MQRSLASEAGRQTVYLGPLSNIGVWAVTQVIPLIPLLSFLLFRF